jgi:hypothetical protein
VNTVMNLRGPIKCWGILEYLSSCCFHKNDSVPWSQLTDSRKKFYGRNIYVGAGIA